MSVSVIGMWAAGTGGTENSAANLDIPQDGFLLGLEWDVAAFLNAASETVEAELSFIATNQLSQNDVRGRISSISGSMHLLTSGVGVVSFQKFVDVKEISVSGGERMYLHINATSGVVSVIRCNLHFEMSGAVRRSARRRG